MRPFKQVDVFTSEVGQGNPVAVVLDGEGLTDDEMARFASWTNLSETTFVTPPTDAGADYRVRIFTPVQELPFAGHPTIGTCHAWLEAGGVPASAQTIVQQCGVGLVTLRSAEGRLSFATPPLMRSGPVADADLDQVLECLGVAEDEVAAAAWVDNGPGWVGILLHSLERLRALRPDLGDRDIKIGAAARTGADPALEVRAFFNAGGTREDPVTGSLNGSLAQWLLGNGTLTTPYRASQGRSLGRNGLVWIDADASDIWVGGDAVTAIEGTARL